MKKTVRKKKTKVPVENNKVKAIKFVCPNCGLEEMRVIYCNDCDSPLDVVGVTAMDEEEAKGNAGVVHDNGEDSEEVTESDVIPQEEDVMEEGLSDIFPPHL